MPDAPPAPIVPPATPATPAQNPPTSEGGAPPASEPKLYAGKYKTVEEMEAGYKALESKLGQRQPAPSQSPTTGNQPPPIAPPEIDDNLGFEEALSKVGLDPTALDAKFTANGKLDDTDYARIKSTLGYRRGDVDRYIGAMREMNATRLEMSVFRAEQFAGGKEQLENIRSTALANLDAGVLKNYNELYTKGRDRLGRPYHYDDYIRDITIELSRKGIGSGAGTTGTAGTSPLINGSARGGSAPAMPQDLKGIGELVRAAQTGDASAIERLKNIPMDQWNAAVGRHINS